MMSHHDYYFRLVELFAHPRQHLLARAERAVRLRSLIAFYLLLVTSSCIYAQAPNWVSPPASDFDRSMNVTGAVNFEGSFSRSQQDQVAFFINNEIRGVGQLLYIPGFGAEAFFTATVFSTVASGETVEIRVYHAATDQVYTASNPLDFVHTNVIGGFGSPYEFMIGTPLDEAIAILPIGVQITLEEVPFEPLDLANFIASSDNDPYTLSIIPLSPGVTWALDNQILSGVPDPGFVGEASVRLFAQEQTANGLSDERVITYRVQPNVMRPNWAPIPPQGAALGDVFPTIDLTMEVDTLVDSCYTFSYLPLFGQNTNEPPPDWMINTTFQSTMTITAQLQFTPSHTFGHPADRLAAFIDDELRGTAVPTDLAGTSVFFLSVGNDVGIADTVRLVLYSGELRRYFNYPPLITYVPFGVMGTAANPEVLDFSNLVPVIHPNRQLEILIQNPDSTAFQPFEFIVADCSFPNQIQDRITVPFCYGNSGGEVSELVNLISGPAEVCQVRTLNLASIVEAVNTNGFTYTWDTSGDGDFLDSAGVGDNRYENSVDYRPGPLDIENGQVTISLRLATGEAMMNCDTNIGNDSVLVIVNRVGTGTFPWDGQ